MVKPLENKSAMRNKSNLTHIYVPSENKALDLAGRIFVTEFRQN